jgi:hypothetical protein
LKVKKLTIPIIIVIFSFLYIYCITGATSRRTQGFHGLFHSAYVYQLVNGIFPPTNPDSIEAPATLYWGWHSIMALLVRLLSITPFEALLLINSLALSATLLCLWKFSTRISSRPLIRIACLSWPFLIIDPIRLFKEFVYKFFGDTFLGTLLKPWILSKGYLFFLHGFVDSRPGTFLVKYLNFTSFPTGVALTLMAYTLVMFSYPRRAGIRLPLVTVLTFLVTFVHPISLVALCVLVGVFSLDRFFVMWRNNQITRAHLIDAWGPSIAVIIGGILALPYIVSLSRAYAEPLHLQIPLSGKELKYHGWAFVPAIPLYFYLLYRFRTLSLEMRNVTVSGIVFVLLTFFVYLPDDNQYKFTLYFGLVSGLLAALLLDKMWSCAGRQNRRIKAVSMKFLVGFLVFLSVVPYMVFGRRYLTNAWARKDPYLYEDRYARLKSDNEFPELYDLQDACDWIRENTQPTDYILTYPVSHNQNQIPFLTGRRTVVSVGSVHSTAVPHHEELVSRAKRVIDSIKECTTYGEAIRDFYELPVQWPEYLYLLIESTEACPALDSLSLVHSNRTQKIYKIEGIPTAN